MRLSSISASGIKKSLRFDCKFHISGQNPLLTKIRSGRWPLQSVGEVFGRANIWQGNIFARVYASEPEFGKPLLVPYDLFRYVPWSDKILSRTQVAQFERLEIKRGWLFVVCSGRNLGPSTIADAFCEQFTMSHDMIRISAGPSPDLFYLAAFLSTTHGQAAIRTDMNGSVIDHTDEKQLAALQYPEVNGVLKERCATSFRVAFEKREKARLLLRDTKERFMMHFGLADASTRFSSKDLGRRFSIRRSEIVDRFDAEPNAPIYKAWRKAVSGGLSASLRDIADVSKPYGRYKTKYVESHTHGTRLMSGRNISQYKPIALKLMNLDDMKSPESFLLRKGMTVLTADGRAEENLGDCALISDDRAGWAASGHVYRVSPRQGVDPGSVYLACTCKPVQERLKSLATGSVVDALNVDDVEAVQVPYDTSAAARAIARDAEKAWALFAEANLLEDAARELLEKEFLS